MRLHHVVRLIVVLVLASPMDLCAAVKVEADKDNVVSSKLEGTWEAHATLTARLGGNDDGTLSFKRDDDVATRVPVKYDAVLKGKQIYMAGVMTRQNAEYPFILIEHKGNPYLVFFIKKGDDAFGNPESFNVILVVAKETAADLLFVGGDFNNQPFSAYGRAKAVVK